MLRNQFGGEVKIEIAQDKVTLGVLRGDELRRSAHVLEGLTDPFQEKTDCPMTQRSTYWVGQSGQQANMLIKVINISERDYLNLLFGQPQTVLYGDVQHARTPTIR